MHLIFSVISHIMVKLKTITLVIKTFSETWSFSLAMTELIVQEAFNRFTH
jgi:hypothetical protein